MHELPVALRMWQSAWSCVLVGGVLLAPACAVGLPEGLTSPDQRVVCNRVHGACYDRLGPSIGLTQAFLGPNAAEALTAKLRDESVPPGRQVGFSPAPGIECTRATGPCLIRGVVHETLTTILFGPWPERSRAAPGRD